MRQGGETEGVGRHECPAGGWEGQSEGGGGRRKDGRGMWGPIGGDMEKPVLENLLTISRNLETYILTGLSPSLSSHT